METVSYRKYTVLSFFILAAIAGYIFFRGLTQVLDWLKYTNVVTAWFGHYPWKVVGGGLSGVIAFILFIWATTNVKAASFFDEVFAEAQKVTWPNAKETYASTLVVCVMVIVSALGLFLLDNVWNWIFKVLLS